MKSQRQAKILEIISNKNIETQEQLLAEQSDTNRNEAKADPLDDAVDGAHERVHSFLLFTN